MLKSHSNLQKYIYSSPAGPILLVADDHALREARWLTVHIDVPSPLGTNDIIRQACRELDEYFRGERREFTVPLHPQGTPYQMEVWEGCRHLPYGRVLTYAQMAQAIGRPTGMRAVAGALRHNPLQIFIPCHRVVSHNGLGGYAAGLQYKCALLAVEHASSPLRPPK